MKTKIIPAIMPTSRRELQETIKRVREHCNIIQIDIMDGVFVREKTWPYIERVGTAIDDHEERATSIPFSDEIFFEVDIMIEKPEERIEYWADNGAKRVIVHIESTQKMGHIIETLHNKNTEVGIALDIATPLDAIQHFARAVDVIQCMGIAQIGYQGEPFDDRVVEKIKALKAAYPDTLISVDGGVNFDSAPLLKVAGANRLVSGSTILKSDDIAATIEELAK